MLFGAGWSADSPQTAFLTGASLQQAHFIAKIYSALNEKELAFSWLERGLAAGSIGFYKDEPVWDSIRNDERYAELLRSMNLPL